MPKVLVTGACGYIGSHTLVELLAAGHDPVSIDDNSRSSESILDGVERITGKRVKNYRVDLRNAALTKAVFSENRDAVAVIHFAAYKTVPESVAKPLLYYDNNINSLLNVLQCTDEFGIPSFIFSSSCSVYGNVGERPRTEDRRLKTEARTPNSDVQSPTSKVHGLESSFRRSGKLPVTEDTPFGEAECPYARTKQMGEQIIQDFSKVSKTRFVSLRYFNPVGAHPSGEIGEVPYSEPDNLFPRITRTAAGNDERRTMNDERRALLVVHGNDYNTRDGTCIRDYIHVSDIARAHVLAIEYLRGTGDGGRGTGDEGQKAECRSPDTANCELETGNSRRSRVGLGGSNPASMGPASNARAETLDPSIPRSLDPSRFEVFNLGSGVGTSVLEAIAAFERATGQKLNYRIGPRRPGDVEAIYANNEKAAAELGWQPRFDIDEMMRTAWLWEQARTGKGCG
ncbi:MAG: UDP-glucose 4-epimerase [bacterium]